MTDIQLFIPCYIDQLYPETGFNTIKILEKAGCKVHYNTWNSNEKSYQVAFGVRAVVPVE